MKVLKANVIQKCERFLSCRLDNVIFDLKQPKAIALLDWELSTIGDPLVDVASLCVYFNVPIGYPSYPCK